MVGRRRLRVAVPPLVTSYPPTTGTGKVWHQSLAALDAEVRTLDPSSRRTFLYRPAVWLHDGHHGPLPVRRPVVAHFHEAAWSDPSLRHMIRPEFLATYEEPSRRAAQQATRLLTSSESSKRQLVDCYGVQPDDVVVIPFGVDHSIYHPRAAGGPEVLDRAGGDGARPYVLFVAQLHPRKNLVVLREAMTRLIQRGYPHSLVIVGGPPLDGSDPAAAVREATSDLPGTSGRVVHLSGIQEGELAAVMAGAAVFCLPSLMEGFGLPALEAMACGVPVVVSDRGALPELVADAGIVTEPTAAHVEAALERLSSDEKWARDLGEAGRVRSLRFTWDATAAGWLRTLEAAA
jgi:glycosyltransferase involved in cell wall biosynthesis